MKKKFGIIAIVLFFVAFGIIFMLNRNDSIDFDGTTYEFVVYDTAQSDISFSRSDKNPKILNVYPWLGAASLSFGGKFTASMSEQQLSKYFEKPPTDLTSGNPQYISNGKFEGEISLVCVEKYLINKEWYLFVGIRRSDFPKGVKYSVFVKRDGLWVFPDGNTDPNGNIVRKIGKINEQVHKRDNSVNFAVKSLSRL